MTDNRVLQKHSVFLCQNVLSKKTVPTYVRTVILNNKLSLAELRNVKKTVRGTVFSFDCNGSAVRTAVQQEKKSPESQSFRGDKQKYKVSVC